MKCLYLGWGRSNAWGVALAGDLGATALFTGEGQEGRVAPRSLLARYARDLRASRTAIAALTPSLVIWQVPPTLAPLIGGEGLGARWGIDMHSGCVNLRRWRWLLPALRWRARTATFTVAHNREVAEILRPWPSPVFVVDNYVVPSNERPTALGRTSGGPVVISASGAVDEPLGIVGPAARLLGRDCEVLITGRPGAVRRRMGSEDLPANVRLTGFLDRSMYLGLLASASVVVCLTTRPATMQLGAWEAASLGCPVVVSEQTVLRQYFNRGACVTNNSPAELAEAIARIRNNYDAYRADAEKHAGEMSIARDVQIEALKRHITESQTQGHT